MSEWETFRDRLLRERPRLRAEYERLEPTYRLISDMIRLRHERGLTQQELARLVGTRQPAIARLESGRSLPSLDTVFRVATALGAAIRLDVVRGPTAVTHASAAARRTATARRRTAATRRTPAGRRKTTAARRKR